MFKDYLLEVIDKNSVLNEGISFSKYVKLRERVEKMTEDEAFKFLDEGWGDVAGAILIGGVLIGGYLLAAWGSCRGSRKRSR